MEQLALELRPDERRPVAPRPRRARTTLRLVHSQLRLFRPRPLPQVRGDCSWARDSGGYPCCPYLSCRHHLWNDRPDEFEARLDAGTAVWPETCSLDVADTVDAATDPAITVGRIISRKGSDKGLLRLVDVGRHIGCSGERARQIEAEALAKLANRPFTRELSWFGDQ